MKLNLWEKLHKNYVAFFVQNWEIFRNDANEISDAFAIPKLHFIHYPRVLCTNGPLNQMRITCSVRRPNGALDREFHFETFRRFSACVACNVEFAGALVVLRIARRAKIAKCTDSANVDMIIMFDMVTYVPIADMMILILIADTMTCVGVVDGHFCSKWWHL